MPDETMHIEELRDMLHDRLTLIVAERILLELR